jgi:hypothetical protein
MKQYKNSVLPSQPNPGSTNEEVRQYRFPKSLVSYSHSIGANIPLETQKDEWFFTHPTAIFSYKTSIKPATIVKQQL